MSGNRETHGRTTSPDTVAAPVAREAGLNVYSGASQGNIGEMMRGPELPTGMVLDFDPSILAGGTTDDILFRDSRPDGFSLARIRLAPDYILPAHHHDVDCLYYVASGSILLGRRHIGCGGGFHVRARQSYGYRAGPEGATVLEFRAATSFDMVVTETSPAKWQEIVRVANEHDGWPGFIASVDASPKG